MTTTSKCLHCTDGFVHLLTSKRPCTYCNPNGYDLSIAAHKSYPHLGAALHDLGPSPSLISPPEKTLTSELVALFYKYGHQVCLINTNSADDRVSKGLEISVLCEPKSLPTEHVNAGPWLRFPNQVQQNMLDRIVAESYKPGYRVLLVANGRKRLDELLDYLRSRIYESKRFDGGLRLETPNAIRFEVVGFDSSGNTPPCNEGHFNYQYGFDLIALNDDLEDYQRANLVEACTSKTRAVIPEILKGYE
jgi:hypothetical protein